MVYVFTPEIVESGGPELLHQLVYVLNLIGVPAKTVYISQFMPFHIVEAKTIAAYEKYNVITEDDISVIDLTENTVVLPEIAFELVDEIKNANVMCWWLSVDAYYNTVRAKYNLSEEDMDSLMYLDYYGFSKRTSIRHLAQSYYAIDFLKSKLQISEDYIDYLSDYLNDIYLDGDIMAPKDRKDMVLFNPAKGGVRLGTLVEATRDEIFWYPIENMTRNKVRAAMNLAKVYVDVGEHPGKDRIPREAAMSGCCVITGRRGSAAYHEDVPIPEKFKIDDSVGVDTEAVKKLILDIFNNFEARQREFDSYRKMIAGEKEKFIVDAMRIFRR